MVHNRVGDEATVPVTKGVSSDGGGKTHVSLLGRTQPEEMVVGTHGSAP
jgi:hypothetical protein